MPVIFVHGSPGFWVNWKLVIERPRLKARFNLIAVNRPGWDDGSASTEVVPEIPVQSNMLQKILDVGHLIPHLRPAEVVIAIEEAASLLDNSHHPIELVSMPTQEK